MISSPRARFRAQTARLVSARACTARRLEQRIKNINGDAGPRRMADLVARFWQVRGSLVLGNEIRSRGEFAACRF